MYMLRHPPDTSSFTTLPRQIRERCDNLGVLSLHDVHMDEEQERPPDVFPERHFLHPDVVQFVKTFTVSEGPLPRFHDRGCCWFQRTSYLEPIHISDSGFLQDDPGK
ncbi:hypothetical protein L210DRAFT_2524343 [Boletus edulis BED1]|uniref:Uncharacterized protein n=1 Tax=Boletus edulis BED1 TaxID=1328754 RepID=A0AAD4BNE3_BOLED|nr:hypothetical protein L210DRAFT_2524343 [Boletus edulis BED1]